MEKKIVIIDDNTEFCDELEETLTMNGFSVVSFHSGKEALESVGKIAPDLILVDLKMEGLSGFETADRLHDCPQTRTTPIIAMSAFYRAHQTFFNIHNIRCCLTKPFSPGDLLSAINREMNTGENNDGG